MKRYAWLFLMLCGAVFGQPARATLEERLPPRLNQAIAPGALDQALFDQAVLIYSNAARAANRLPPLVQDGKLSRAAAVHAANMARLRSFGHSVPVRGQASFQERIDRVSLRYRLAGENIAMDKVYRLVGRPISTRMSGCDFTYGDTRAAVPIHSYATLASDVVNRWMNSPGHRANLLSRNFTRIGSAMAIDFNGGACGDVYVVQDFAG